MRAGEMGERVVRGGEERRWEKAGERRRGDEVRVGEMGERVVRGGEERRWEKAGGEEKRR